MAFPRGFGYRRAEVDAHVAAQERAIAALGAEVERLRAADPLARATTEVTELIATFARVVADLRTSAEREAISVRRAAEEEAALVRDEAGRLLERERTRASLAAEDILRRAHHEVELLTRTQGRVDQALNEAARGIVSMIDLFDHLRLPSVPAEPGVPPPEEIDLRDPPHGEVAPRGPAERWTESGAGEHEGGSATAAGEGPVTAPREGGPGGAATESGPVGAAPAWPAPDPAARVAVPDAPFGASAPGPAFRRMPADRTRLPRPPDPAAPDVRQVAADVRRREDTSTPFGSVPFDPRSGRVVDFDPPADDEPF